MTHGEKGLKPVYLIYGDKYLIEEALTRLENRFTRDGEFGLNYDEFYGGETGAVEIINALSTLTFSSGRRLVVVKDADKLKASEVKGLKTYIEKPISGSCLVLVAERIKKSSALYKALSDGKAEVFEYKSLKKSEYPAWIKDEFKKQGKKATDELANFLYESVGDDLMRLQSEITKITFFNIDKEEVTLADAENLVSKSAESTIWELVDSVGHKKEAKALSILDDLLKQGEAETKILYMIVRQIGLILKTKSLSKKKMKDFEIARHIKQPPFVVQKCRDQSENFTEKELTKAMEHLLDTEVAIKTGQQEPRLALETLIHNLCT